MGERVHLSPGGLDTHVTDVDHALRFGDYREVHLVLHGYAGALAGPLAQRSARIASVIYVSGAVVLPGETVPPTPTGLDHVTDPVIREWAGARVTPWEAGSLPIDYDPQPLAALRQVYLRTVQPPVAALEPSWQRAMAAGWETHELTAGIAAMITAPRQTARLLETAGPRDVLPPVFPASPRIALW
jgi:pimeloyl-ACP methyl ester carboxylesterase